MIGPSSSWELKRAPILNAGCRSERSKSTCPATPTATPHRCCSPTSPRVITCGTSSCVGHSPEAMHPKTPHSSRIPNSSSSMSPLKARGGAGRCSRGTSTKQLPARPESLRSWRCMQTAASFPAAKSRYCGGACLVGVTSSSPPCLVPGPPMRESGGERFSGRGEES